MRRFGVGLVLAVAALTLLPSVAVACLEPQVFVDPGEAKAGDQVSFDLTNTERGADWSLSVDGIPVASGTDADDVPGVSGTFNMPNLGAEPRTVSAEAVTSHDGSGWRATRPMQYEFVVAEPPPSNGEAGGGGGSITGGGGPAEEPEATGQHDGDRGDSAAGGSEAPGVSPASAPSVAAQAQQPELGSEAAVNHERSQRGSIDERAAVVEQSEKTADDEATGARVLDLALPDITELVTDGTQVGPATVPTISLILLGLIFLAGMLAVSVVGYLAGRLTPDPRRIANEVGAVLTPDAIDAELQEMIAEQRAKRLSVEGDRASS